MVWEFPHVFIDASDDFLDLFSSSSSSFELSHFAGSISAKVDRPVGALCVQLLKGFPAGI